MIANILSNLAKGPLNVLTAPTHERYQSHMGGVDATFWLYRHPSFKSWRSEYAPLPDNHSWIPEGKYLPGHVDIDLVLIQNKFGQAQVLLPLAEALHVPTVIIEHTVPMPTWPKEQIEACKRIKGHINLFISEYSRAQWGWGEHEAGVIHHGICTKTFSPQKGIFTATMSRLLSVVNDWKNRELPCGYNYWVEATQGLPVHVLGDTPGLSEPARSTAELVSAYRTSQIFVNTSQHSPIPTALLEAMSCGCCVVSANTCMVPEVINHGENGFLCESPKEMRALCVRLLNEPELCLKVGAAARKTVEERFALPTFVKNWQRVLDKARDIIPYQKGTYV